MILKFELFLILILYKIRLWNLSTGKTTSTLNKAHK